MQLNGWQLLPGRLNTPLCPEFAEEKTNEDGGKSSVKYKRPVIIYRLGAGGIGGLGEITCFLGEQKGGSFVIGNLKGGITEKRLLWNNVIASPGMGHPFSALNQIPFNSLVCLILGLIIQYFFICVLSLIIRFI